MFRIVDLGSLLSLACNTLCATNAVMRPALNSFHISELLCDLVDCSTKSLSASVIGIQ